MLGRDGQGHTKLYKICNVQQIYTTFVRNLILKILQSTCNDEQSIFQVTRCVYIAIHTVATCNEIKCHCEELGLCNNVLVDFDVTPGGFISASN